MVCQVMKDLSDTIRQIIITKNNRRYFVEAYYTNGQLMDWLPLDLFYHHNGALIYYYENGNIESKGHYEYGLKKEECRNYSKKRKMIFKKVYDLNGNVNKMISP